MSTINITLETLYDVLRNEKKNEELQELSKTFYLDVVAYMREKKALLESRKDEDELFATSERKKLEYEMRSIKRILKEIYEKREKKIIAIALNKSRTGSEIIDTSSMLTEEKEFFKEIVEHFDIYRRGVLLHLWRAKLPSVKRKSPVLAALSQEVSTSLESDLSEGGDTQETLKTGEQELTEVEEAAEEEMQGSETSSTEKAPEIEEEPEEKKPVVKVKFLHAVPRFLWKDMKEYGPFRSGDEAEIYPEIADLLERKGRAEKV